MRFENTWRSLKYVWNFVALLFFVAVVKDCGIFVMKYLKSYLQLRNAEEVGNLSFLGLLDTYLLFNIGAPIENID